MIYDIRNEEDLKVTGIRYDDSGDYIAKINGFYIIETSAGDVRLCREADLDNFIKSLQKAKEIL